jgi:hypothetical protein
MTMAPKLSKLRAMSDDEIVAIYDDVAQHTGVGLQFYLDELVRRETRRTNEKLVELTDKIRLLTLATTAAAIVALAISVVALVQQQ